MSDSMIPWHLTIIRMKGMSLMRAEKSWRPIITIDVNEHHSHELLLGCDGQNPNLKNTITFYECTTSSKLVLKVWRCSQSKKKGKKRMLVASASHDLGELVKKQGTDSHAEIQLTCQQPNKKCTASRGKPQGGAVVLCRVRPPPDVHFSEPISDQTSDYDYLTDSFTAAASEPSSSRHSSEGKSPDPETTQTHTLRKRRIKGFMIHSEEELFSATDEEDHDMLEKTFQEEDNIKFDQDDDNSTCYDDRLAIRHPPDGFVGTYNPVGWIAAALLPQYTVDIETPPPLSRTELLLSSFTMYRDLKSAIGDSQFEEIFALLKLEWTYCGGLLAALAAVNAAVFSISPDSVFKVDSYASSAVAASSVTSGLGIACDAWFLLRYNWTDLNTFKARAQDVYESYAFFALSSRVPTLCMFMSAISLMCFLVLVAFNHWPRAIWILCFLIGVTMTLQYLVYGIHRFALIVVGGYTAITRGFTRIFRKQPQNSDPEMKS